MNPYITRAKSSLRNSSNSRMLVILHSGVIAAAAIVILLADYFLDQRIGTTGGLSGMGTRAVLSTARSVLRLGMLVFQPFWNVGILFAALKILRGEQADQKSLLQGFRNAGPVLSVMLMEYLAYLGVAMLAVFVAAEVLVNFTAMGRDIVELVTPYVATGLDESASLALAAQLMPLTNLAVAAGVLSAFVYSYRFRIAMFCVLDAPQEGGRMAMFRSKLALKGKKLQLFLLDLRFWWYYLALAFVHALAYADLILIYFGFELPMSADAMVIVCNILYIVGVFAVSVGAKNLVNVTYAAFYEAAMPAEEE